MTKYHLRKKHYVDQSVLELARERLRFVFERFDFITVGFSGGKDSTCCLNLAIEVAQDTKRLPLHVYTFDEEAIPPETVEYMARVGARPDVKLDWYCVPIQHRNACSTRELYWYPWQPELRERWVRELPAQAITDYPGLTRTPIAAQMAALFPASLGSIAHIMGIRAQDRKSVV